MPKNFTCGQKLPGPGMVLIDTRVGWRC